MSLQQINLGNIANDGTGDDLRTAFQKVIHNFNQLDARTPEATTAVNLGSGQGIFASKSEAELRFKSIQAGQNVTLAADGQTITINVNAGVTEFTIEADTGSILMTEDSTIKFEGGRLITTERDGNSIVINSSALSSISEDSNPTLSAGLNANGFPLSSVGAIDATTVSAIFIGNLTGLVHGIDIRNLNYYTQPQNSWDFNGITTGSVTNVWDYVWKTVEVDFGGIANNGTVDINPSSPTFGQYVGSNTPSLDFGTFISPL